MIRLRKAKPGSDHDCEYSFAHRVWQTSYRLFDFEVSQPMPCQSVHLKSFPFALHFYTFLKISLAGIYGLCINSIIHYIWNINLYNQYSILSYLPNNERLVRSTKKYYMRCETQSNANGIHTPPISMLSEISVSRFKPWRALYQDLGYNYLSHFLLSKDAIVFNLHLDVIGF